jgi:hypothetical protein
MEKTLSQENMSESLIKRNSSLVGTSEKGINNIPIDSFVDSKIATIPNFTNKKKKVYLLNVFDPDSGDFQNISVTKNK